MKKVVRFLSLFLICCLTFFSCALQTAEDNTGSISFTLPGNKEVTRSYSRSPSNDKIEYRIKLTSLSSNQTVYDEVHPEGNIVTIDNLVYGDYEISVSGETRTIRFSKTQKVEVRKPKVSVNITLDVVLLTGNVELKINNTLSLPFTKYSYELRDGEKTIAKKEVDASEGDSILISNIDVGTEVKVLLFAETVDTIYVAKPSGNIKPVEQGKTTQVTFDEFAIASGSVDFIGDNIDVSKENPITVTFKSNDEGRITKTQEISSLPITINKVLKGNYTVFLSRPSSNNVFVLSENPITVEERGNIQINIQEVPPLNSDTLYVNGTSGDDLANDGSELKPLKTVSRACEVIQAFSDKYPSFTINVEGETKETNEIFIHSTVNITIQGKGGTPAVIKAINSNGSESIESDHRVMKINGLQGFPSITLKNITITGGNSIQGSSEYALRGCGIRLDNGSLILDDGAIITNNKGTNINDGIFVNDDAKSFIMSGSAKVDASNTIYLRENKMVNISGPLTASGNAATIDGDNISTRTTQVLIGAVYGNHTKFALPQSLNYKTINEEGNIVGKVLTVEETRTVMTTKGVSFPLNYLIQITASEDDLPKLSQILKEASLEGGPLHVLTYDGAPINERPSIDLRTSTFTRIKSDTFAGVLMGSLYLPDTIEVIEGGAFGNGDTFVSLYFADTTTPWENSSHKIFTPSEAGNENLAKFKQGGEFSSGVISKFVTAQRANEILALNTETSVRVMLKTEEDYSNLGGAIKGCSAPINVTMISKIPYIPDNAFKDARNLNYINIPLNIFMIGKDAFTGSGLKELEFSDVEDGLTYNYAVWKKAGSNESYPRPKSDGAHTEQATNILALNSERILKAEGFNSSDNKEFDELKKVTSGDIYAGFVIENDSRSKNKTTYQQLVDFIKLLNPNVNLHLYLYASSPIPESTFNGCTQLKSVNIPTYMTTIDAKAFEGSGVTSITFDSIPLVSQNWTSTNGSFSPTPNGVDNYNNLKTAGKISRKLSLSEVDDICTNTTKERLFYNFDVQIDVSELTQLQQALWKLETPISENYESIDKARYNIDLSSCTSITTIEAPAFSGYDNKGFKGMVGIILPSSVTSIGNQAFYNSWNLDSFTIPSSVTSIGSDVFTVYNLQGSPDPDLGVDTIFFEDTASTWNISGTASNPTFTPSSDGVTNAKSFEVDYRESTWTKN